MPIGLMSPEQFEQELANLSQRVTPKESHPEKIESHGRNEGDLNVPDSLRQIIGEDSVINGRSSALKLASQFGLSPSSVSAYAKGTTSTTTYHQPKESIISHINRSRMRATKKASHTLNAALSAISQEKLDYADAKDLSTIAKDMSVVIKNLEPPSASATVDAASPQFVIFAPTFRDERSFETIQVKE